MDIHLFTAIADVADDVITVTTGWKKDGRLTHPRNDIFVDFDHGTALIMSGNNRYSAEIVVGITDKGEYVFYYVTNINPDTYKIWILFQQTAYFLHDYFKFVPQGHHNHSLFTLHHSPRAKRVKGLFCTTIRAEP